MLFEAYVGLIRHGSGGRLSPRAFEQTAAADERITWWPACSSRR